MGLSSDHDGAIARWNNPYELQKSGAQDGEVARLRRSINDHHFPADHLPIISGGKG